MSLLKADTINDFSGGGITITSTNGVSVSSGIFVKNGVVNLCATTGSTVNAYVLALSSLASPTAGMTIHFVAVGDNTSTVTVNLNSTGVVTVLKSNRQSLTTKDLLNGKTYSIRYDGVNWILLNPESTLYSDILWGWIGGLNLSTAGSSTTLSISAGRGAESNNNYMLRNNSAINKILNPSGVWTSGSGGNGIPANITVAANTWYHVFALGKSTDSTIFDIGFDTSLTATNLLLGSQAPGNTGIDLYRRIGSIYSDASKNIKRFFQKGNYFWWETPILNSVTTATNAGTGALRTLAGQTNGDVPLGLDVIALCNAQLTDTSGSGVSLFVWDLALGNTRQDTYIITSAAGSGAAVVISSSSAFQVRVDASQRVYNAVNAGFSTAQINTLGWIDHRGTDL